MINCHQARYRHWLMCIRTHESIISKPSYEREKKTRSYQMKKWRQYFLRIISFLSFTDDKKFSLLISASPSFIISNVSREEEICLFEKNFRSICCSVALKTCRLCVHMEIRRRKTCKKNKFLAELETYFACMKKLYLGWFWANDRRALDNQAMRAVWLTFSNDECF